MASNSIYIIEPNPDNDYLMKLERFLSKEEYHLSIADEEDLCFAIAKEFILKYGTTKMLSMQPLNEQVLPDNTSRDIISDILKTYLRSFIGCSSILIIDPYLYSSNSDSDYISFFINLFQDLLVSCLTLKIATSPDQNCQLEQSIHNAIKVINPNIRIYTKHTRVFHDRFWIFDDTKGLLIGTSLNGIGRRYSLIDYLKDDDVKEIVHRYSEIS
jgi:hypothetical protein